MLIRRMQYDFKNKDERGELIQLVHEGYKQVNYIFSKAGEVRGNHYHKYNEEAYFIIRGKVRVTVIKDRTQEEYYFSGGEMFEIPRMVKHIFFYEEDTDLVSLYSSGVELGDGKMDLWTG